MAHYNRFPLKKLGTFLFPKAGGTDIAVPILCVYVYGYHKNIKMASLVFAEAF